MKGWQGRRDPPDRLSPYVESGMVTARCGSRAPLVWLIFSRARSRHTRSRAGTDLHIAQIERSRNTGRTWTRRFTATPRGGPLRAGSRFGGEISMGPCGGIVPSRGPRDPPRIRRAPGESQRPFLVAHWLGSSLRRSVFRGHPFSHQMTAAQWAGRSRRGDWGHRLAQHRRNNRRRASGTHYSPGHRVCPLAEHLTNLGRGFRGAVVGFTARPGENQRTLGSLFPVGALRRVTRSRAPQPNRNKRVRSEEECCNRPARRSRDGAAEYNGISSVDPQHASPLESPQARIRVIRTFSSRVARHTRCRGTRRCPAVRPGSLRSPAHGLHVTPVRSNCLHVEVTRNPSAAYAQRPSHQQSLVWLDGKPVAVGECPTTIAASRWWRVTAGHALIAAVRSGPSRHPARPAHGGFSNRCRHDALRRPTSRLGGVRMSMRKLGLFCR